MTKESNKKKEITSADVISLYADLENLGIQIWIDGGWAVDALLGEQMRPHEDLDVAIERNNLMKLREYFEARGYREIERDENKKWDLVLSDNDGHEIDVHSFDTGEDGKIIEEKYWDGYSENSLSGLGIINGHKVRCASLDQLIKTHDSEKRKLKETDHKDISALRKKFGV